MSEKKMTMGVIIGNRGFFPDQLAKSGREEMIQALAKAGIDCVVLGPEDSKHGAVETHEEAKRCAALFQKNREKIDGVIVSLPNFGDERAIADTMRMARLDVPILVQATPDDAANMTILHRRDSFCGKMSACNNLRQYGIPYSLTKLHTVSPGSQDFENDLAWFAAVCRVANGMRNLRVGSIGARPTAFNTVRYSEKLLEAHGISTETLDLSPDFFRDFLPLLLPAERMIVDLVCVFLHFACQCGSDLAPARFAAQMRRIGLELSVSTPSANISAAIPSTCTWPGRW